MVKDTFKNTEAFPGGARITPILQARMGSSRLPGKVLMKIGGGTILSSVISRVRLAGGLEPPIVATTVNPADGAVEAECARLGAICFRGSETDVLSRFYEAAALHGARHIMRVCCDNPLIDPGTLSALADFYRENSYSYVTSQGVPLGLAAEIFTFGRLEDAHLHGKKPYHREHVTPYMYENGAGCGRLVSGRELSHLRFTVDTPEDFAFASAVYGELYEKSPGFGLEDVLGLIEARPELVGINRGVAQKRYDE